MEKEELQKIYGGVSFSATLLNAVIKGVTFIFELGKSLASSIVRSKTNNLCDY